MSKRLGKVNKPFLIWSIMLIVGGFFIFSSASLGILVKSEIKFSSIAFNQLFFGLFLGSIACIAMSRIDPKLIRKYSVIFFVFSILLTLMVYLPKIGLSHGGARRWIDLGFISFQPSEFLKIGFVIYLAAWLSTIKSKVETFKWGLFPFIILSSMLGLILLAQPDTDTFAVTIFAALSMYIAAGAKWKHILYIFITGILCIALLATLRPYVKQRIDSMIHPSKNTKTSSYQLNQSLIAVGSGGIWGRGFGQSVQKFHYLPEPVGDSVFAVAAEEFGFVGALIIVLLFVMFGISGLKIATMAPDDFSRLLGLGIVILIISQAFLNIGGMLGILPLTGIPLPFISHGGTALFIVLAETGILMSISRKSTIK
jgi:cell division protein FtsW